MVVSEHSVVVQLHEKRLKKNQYVPDIRKNVSVGQPLLCGAETWPPETLEPALSEKES